MAVTYNAWQNLGYIYTDDGGVFSANNAANTAFDYLPNDAAVNDALYFGNLAGNSTTHLQNSWRNLKLYVGTAFAATSVTFAWEYYNGSSWTALSNVVDGTSNFSVLGENTVTWDMPTNWVPITINGVSCWWVRCRISAINTPTEGGAQSTQTVQSGDNTIVVTGTGNTFDTIYNADVAGGWGIFTPNNGTYLCHAELKIGDGSTTTELTATLRILRQVWYFQTTAASTLTLGSYNSVLGGYDGSIIYFTPASGAWDKKMASFNGTLNLYGSGINGNNEGANVSFSGTVTMYDSYVGRYTGYSGFASTAVSGTFVRTSLTGRGSSFGFEKAATIDNCRFSTLKVSKNLTLVNSNGTTFLSTTFMNNPQTVYLQNCSFTSFSYTGHSGQSHTIYVQYGFDLKVIDGSGNAIAGATVTITDAGGTEVFNGTTDANGEITQQNLNKEIRTKIIGQDEVITTKTPHTVTISKAGFITKTIKYTMDRKREEVEVLEKEVPIFIGKGKVLVNVDPKNNQNNILI